MSNSRSRNRVVYFRVTEEEYEQMTALCDRHGARTLSELIRSAMDLLAKAENNHFEQEVTRRLSELERSLDWISQNMGAPQGSMSD